MDFSEALIKLKEGHSMYRTNWNGVKAGIPMWVYLTYEAKIRFLDGGGNTNDLDEMSPFFIFHHTENKTDNIWTPSMWDIMATDWVEQ